MAREEITTEEEGKEQEDKGPINVDGFVFMLRQVLARG